MGAVAAGGHPHLAGGGGAPGAGRVEPIAVHVFVYGTLLPGEERWHHLEPFAAVVAEALASGRLYDTGRGYPAAVFGGQGVIRGIAARLAAGRVDTALARLDEVESTAAGLYRRVEVGVRTAAGERVVAWSYEYGAEVADLEFIDGGDWRHR